MEPCYYLVTIHSLGWSHIVKNHFNKALKLFVGREEEIQEIGRLLHTPECRLLTLIGPGGIGKTSLALRIIEELKGNFPDGTFFIPLQAVDASSLLLRAIVDALGLHLTDQQSLEQQLTAYLQEKAVLLLLDNFEQLRDTAVQLMPLLNAAPQFKLLITSREALNISGEWLFPVVGLPYPQSAHDDNWQTYPAVTLFANHACKIRPGFQLPEEADGVVKICQQTEGSPLALELAASWVQVLPCLEIAAEIQQSLDLLSTRFQDTPPQHRNMRAVFQQTWSRLTAAEQQTFARLSIFRGGFQRPAAKQIASASINTLYNLADRSLLRLENNGRFQIHQLLRQYGAEQFAQDPTAEAKVQELHGRYYMSYLIERTVDLRGGRQREALLELDNERENIRLAWEWAVAYAQVDLLTLGYEPLNLFHDLTGRYLEGLQAFIKAIEAISRLPQNKEAVQGLALLHLVIGGLYLRVGQLDEATHHLQNCQKRYDEIGITPPSGYLTDPNILLGLIASTQGGFEEAERLGQQALQQAQETNHLLNQQVAYYLLTRAALLQNQLEEAHQYAQMSYECTQQTQDHWFMAYCFNELGHIALMLGDYSAARQHYTASYQIRHEFDDPEGMALALSHLGAIASQTADYAEAERLYQESLAIAQQINNRGNATLALQGLARNALAQGDVTATRPYLQQALQLVQEGQLVSLFLSLLVDIARLFARAENLGRASALWSLVAEHPGSEPEAREQAQQFLSQHTSFPPQTAVDPTADWFTLQQLAVTLQTELSFLNLTATASPPSSFPTPSPLVEPLTPRETEVLTLMAAGLSNNEIAQQLILAIGTVKYYTSEIYGKLGVRNRIAAVRRAQELNLIP